MRRFGRNVPTANTVGAASAVCATPIWTRLSPVFPPLNRPRRECCVSPLILLRRRLRKSAPSFVNSERSDSMAMGRRSDAMDVSHLLSRFPLTGEFNP